MYCEKCGHVLQEGDVHCAFCGTKRQGRIGTAVAGADGNPLRRRAVILLSYAAGLIVFVATALIFGGGQLFGDKGKPAGPALQASPTAVVVASIDAIPTTPAPVATPAKLSIGEEAASKAMEGYTDDTAVVFADSQVEAFIRANYISKQGAITVADMRGMRYFQCESNSGVTISTLFDLRYCDNLEVVSVVGQPIRDIESLRGLTKLRSVWIVQGSVSDLSPLAGKGSLQEFTIMHTPISDVSPVLALPSLKVFCADDTSITDISALRGTDGLLEFHCSNKLDDVTPLFNHKGLTKVSLKGLSNDSFLALLDNMSYLTYLDISSSSITNTSLTQLLKYNLDSLFLQNCAITDVSTFSNLNTVRYLRLTGNQIEDISPLSRLTELEELALGGNPISDYSVIDQIEKNGCKVYR